MTFTFATPFNNISLVRFNIGDVNSDRAIFTDEVIQAAIDYYGTWQIATVNLIQNIIMQLSSNPDFKADWLQSDYKTSLQYYTDMITRVARQLGVPYGQIQASAGFIWRPDSRQTAPPVYPQDGPGGGGVIPSAFNLTG